MTRTKVVLVTILPKTSRFFTFMTKSRRLGLVLVLVYSLKLNTENS